ncbi:unnamed protein product [Cunninghamella blakesleeana]
MGLLGGILVLFGLQLIGFGYRYYRLTLSIANSIIFGASTWIALINNKPAGGYSQDHITMFIVPFIIGILGFLLCFYYCKYSIYSIYLISVLCGATLALYICSWREDLVIPSMIGRIIFFTGLPFLFVILTIFFERQMLLFCISFCGSFIFILGVDLLTHTGYIQFSWLLLTKNSDIHPFPLTRLMLAMLVLISIITVISYLWQIVFNVRYRYFHILSKQDTNDNNDEEDNQHQHQQDMVRVSRRSISTQSVSPTPTHYEP